MPSAHGKIEERREITQVYRQQVGTIEYSVIGNKQWRSQGDEPGNHPGPSRTFFYSVNTLTTNNKTPFVRSFPKRVPFFCPPDNKVQFRVDINWKFIIGIYSLINQHGYFSQQAAARLCPWHCTRSWAPLTISRTACSFAYLGYKKKIQKCVGIQNPEGEQRLSLHLFRYASAHCTRPPMIGTHVYYPSSTYVLYIESKNFQSFCRAGLNGSNQQFLSRVYMQVMQFK